MPPIKKHHKKPHHSKKGSHSAHYAHKKVHASYVSPKTPWGRLRLEASLESKGVQKLLDSPQHNDMTTKYVKISMGRKGKKVPVETWYNHQQVGVLQAGGLGAQYYGDLYTIGELGTQILQSGTTYSATVAGATNNAWTNNPFDMNPNQFNSGSALKAATNTSAANVVDRAFWHSCSGESMFTNSTNTPVEFNVYWFTPKKAHGISNGATYPGSGGPVSTIWGNVEADVALRASGASVARGIGAAATAPTTGAENAGLVGASPFRFPQFRSLLKTLHTEKHVLMPGATKKIKFHIAMNKLLDRDMLKVLQNTSQVNYIPGVTIHCFVIARGVPVYDNGTNKQVTVSAAELLHTMSYTNTYSYPVAEKRHFVNYYDANFGFDATTTNAALINDVDVSVGGVKIV